MKADYVDQFSIITKPEAGLVLINLGQVEPMLQEINGMLEVTNGQVHELASVWMPVAMAMQLAQKLSAVIVSEPEKEA
jgi:hypothetical protein